MRTLRVVLLCLVLSGCMADEQAASVAVPPRTPFVGSDEARPRPQPVSGLGLPGVPPLCPIPSDRLRELARLPATGCGQRAPEPARPVPPTSRLIAKPSHTGALGTSSHVAGRVQGVASWYCGHGSACTHGYPGGLYAAAGPALRVGDWRGRLVTVRSGGLSVRVVLIDWCACPNRALDLYSTAFLRLAPLSRGLVKVTVSW